MKCFSIIDDEIKPYIDMSSFPWCSNFPAPCEVTTAALQLYVDSDWESKDILNGIRFRNNKDALLYGIAYLAEGDTASDIIPAGSIALCTPVTGFVGVSDPHDTSMVITFNETHKIFLCFQGSTYIRSVDGGYYVINQNGEPSITTDKPFMTEPLGGTIWEF